MYKFILGILFFVVSQSVYAQRSTEAGVAIGTGYYMGDINPSQQFYSSLPMFGFVYRYNIDPRYALKGSFNFGSLRGSDFDFNNEYQQLRAASFETNLVDISLQMEFNFQPYFALSTRDTKRFSPYVTSGVSYISSSSTSSSFAIPMGVGCKFLLVERLTLAAEWVFKKTFTDGLDGLKDPNNMNVKNKFHNDDWISFLGVTLTLQFFDNIRCHAYNRNVR